MILEQPLCPCCGEPAIGTCDFVPGICHFNDDPRDGNEVDYDGGTKMLWDGSTNEAQLAHEPETELIRRLVEWANNTGGWDAAVWRDAEAYLAKIDDPATVMRVQCHEGHQWDTIVED